jgi:hypothetical protein
MAIRHTFNLQDNFNRNVQFDNCYAKVAGIDGSKDGITFTIEIRQAQDDKNVLTSQHYFFVPSLEGKNFIAQAYDFLKSKPEFATAQDC